MDLSQKPDEKLALLSLPPELFSAIKYFFKFIKDENIALVGGTALSGFYAAHRRSEDIDLFTGSEAEQNLAEKIVQSFTKIGANFLSQQKSPFYYHSVAEIDNYRFTIDVVLDKNLFSIANSFTTLSHIKVVDLETILKMKIATLISRCSEKDLYDLLFFHRQVTPFNLEAWIDLGRSIDQGIALESLAISLLIVTLKESACQFSLDQKPSAEILKEIISFKNFMLEALTKKILTSPDSYPALERIVKKLKKFSE